MEVGPTPWARAATARRETLSLVVAVLLVVLLAGACSPLPPGATYPKTASVAFDRPEETTLGKRFLETARTQGGRSGFHMVGSGVDAFLIRAQMIEAAERSIDLQYFVFNDDKTGRLLMRALERAADRGVRVRMLVDDYRAAENELLAGLAGHPGIEVRIFNPLRYRGKSSLIRTLEFLGSKTRLNTRMHNKMLAVDNAVALVGGRNVGDRYFQLSPRSWFGDEDVFCAGPVAGRLTAAFDEYWNSTLAIPAEALEGGRARRPARAAAASGQGRNGDEADIAAKNNPDRIGLDKNGREKDGLEIGGVSARRLIASGQPLSLLGGPEKPLEWAFASPVHDSPYKAGIRSGAATGPLVNGNVSRRLEQVRQELLIMTPFFVPDDEWTAMLRRLLARGGRVGVLTNSLESSIVLLAHSAYMGHRRQLAAAGADIHEVRAGQNGSSARFSLHAKVFVFDRESLFIGSMNFDRRSLHINTESGLIIESPELARQAAERFEALADPENSYQVTLERSEEGGRRLVWRTRQGGETVEHAREPARSDWQRLKAGLLRLVPLDEEL